LGNLLPKAVGGAAASYPQCIQCHLPVLPLQFRDWVNKNAKKTMNHWKSLEQLLLIHLPADQPFFSDYFITELKGSTEVREKCKSSV